MDLYQRLLRPVLFSGWLGDEETLHRQALGLLEGLAQARSQPWGGVVRSPLQGILSHRDPRLVQTRWGLTFPNPVGLAAGFDKDGVAAPLWGDLGFGFAELGTVTYHPQPGNPQPRLFRLVADGAILNRMGFNNQGAAALAQRLGAVPAGAGGDRVPLGINLGKSKITPLEQASEDYCASFRLLKPWGDYFVVNVSSPNTPGLRSLQAAEALDPLLGALQRENQGDRPLLLKISPDLAWADLEEILDLVQRHQLAGIIATNTTIQREGLRTATLKATGQSPAQEAGGLSGAPLADRSTAIVRFLWQKSQGQVPIIGVGGVASAEEAWAKITAGACLVQLYTAWIYGGPGLIRQIVKGLGQKLTAAGMTHLDQAIGSQA